MTDVTLIGLEAMGSALAKALISAEYKITVKSLTSSQVCLNVPSLQAMVKKMSQPWSRYCERAVLKAGAQFLYNIHLDTSNDSTSLREHRTRPV